MTASTWWSCEFPCRSTGGGSLPRFHDRPDHGHLGRAGGWGHDMPAPFSAICLAVGLALLAPTPRLAPPLTPFRVIANYRPPLDAFAAGHRGVDLAAHSGQSVHSPMTGIVTFAGSVGGRPVLSIASGETVVSLEPVATGMALGTSVRRGDLVGWIASGGHCEQRCLHVGLRVSGRYAAPFALRARLAPWS